MSEVVIFARFHARADAEKDVAEALRTVVPPTRTEAGCLAISAHRSIRDPRLFFIHSRWRDEAAFESHAAMPHTIRFIERVQTLIDHELDVNRTHKLD